MAEVEADFARGLGLLSVPDHSAADDASFGRDKSAALSGIVGGLGGLALDVADFGGGDALLAVADFSDSDE